MAPGEELELSLKVPSGTVLIHIRAEQDGPRYRLTPQPTHGFSEHDIARDFLDAVTQMPDSVPEYAKHAAGALAEELRQALFGADQCPVERAEHELSDLGRLIDQIPGCKYHMSGYFTPDMKRWIAPHLYCVFLNGEHYEIDVSSGLPTTVEELKRRLAQPSGRCEDCKQHGRAMAAR
jgi:hypothetical protein